MSVYVKSALSAAIVFLVMAGIAWLLIGASPIPILARSETNLTALNVRSFGARGDGKTDDTRAMQEALNSAAGRVPLWIPAGKYLVDTLSLRGPSLTVFGDGLRYSTLVSKSGKDILVLGPAKASDAPSMWPVSIRDLGFSGAGVTGNTGRGLVIQDAYGVNVQNVYVVNCGGDAVELNDTTYSAQLENVLAGFGGGCGFKIAGAPSVNLINCYALQVPEGKAGYWLYSGNINLFGCNGIMGPSGIWGRIGSSTLDGQSWSSEADVTLVGCNVESCEVAGLQVRHGSRVSVLGPSTFLSATPAAGHADPLGIQFEDESSARNSAVDSNAEFVFREKPMVHPFSGGMPKRGPGE